MSKIIILNNKSGQVETEEEHLKKIKKICSYKQPGIEFTPGFQMGWSGIIQLINKKNQFALGLVKTIENYFIENNILYSIEDRRATIVDNTPLDISENLKKINMTPREHQLRILESVKNLDRGIIRAATSSGKTLAVSLITAHFNKPTIIYVIGLDLLDQFYKLFSSIFDEEIGYIGNGICNPQRITIASIWTLGKALDLKVKLDDETLKEKFDQNNKLNIIKCLKEAKIHLMDESHIGSCSTMTEIYKAINPERLYGLSGTPFKGDGTDILLTSIFGQKICEISASELIEKDLITQPIIKFIKVPKLYVQGGTYQEVYKEYVVENPIRNNLILSHTKSLIDKGYKPLVLFKTIAHGKKIFEMFENAGIRCALLSGNDKLEKRNLIKTQLNNNEIDCIIASVIFDIGLDLPILSGLVLAGPTKSFTRVLQRVGRIIRKYPGKKHAAVVDFYDDIRYLKTHSKKRFETYSTEPGFKIIKCSEL